MAPLKPVVSLHDLSVKSVGKFVEWVIRDAVDMIVDLDFEGDFEECNAFRKELIRKFVRLFREHLSSHVTEASIGAVKDEVLSSVERVASSLSANAMDEDMSLFSLKMFVVVEFTALVITPKLRCLDLTDVVKMLRSKLFELLPLFPDVLCLRLGSGSGGMSDVFQAKFVKGLEVMKKLVEFSLHYDANNEIIRVLSKNCRSSLRVLDVEHSAQVTDEVVEDVASCQLLEKLHIFHTGLTTFGQAHLIKRLRRLRILVRGDFLCDAIELIANENDGGCVLPRFESIEEFWSSEDYFFHNSRQLQLTAQMCPNIKKMMFQFSEEHVASFMELDQFRTLTELHSWGGDFYANKLDKLIISIGNRLKVLYLIHMDEVDQGALVTLSNHCPNLETLGFYNCIFYDEFLRHSIERYDGSPSMMKPILELQKFSMVSEATRHMFIFLLSVMINIKSLTIGSSTSFTDDTLAAVQEKNALQKLQDVRIARSSTLTIASAYSLIENCPKLQSITDLAHWDRVSMNEIQLLKLHIRQNNLDVHTGDDRHTLLSQGRMTTHYWSRQSSSLQQV